MRSNLLVALSKNGMAMDVPAVPVATALLSSDNQYSTVL